MLKIGSCSYNETNKEKFKKWGKSLLRKVIKLLELKKGEYDLRYNPAGIACSGDHTLHTDNIYVHFNLDVCNWVLVRTCKSRKDYTGGVNRQYPFEKLENEGAEGLAKFIQKIQAESKIFA